MLSKALDFLTLPLQIAIGLGFAPTVAVAVSRVLTALGL